MVDIMFDVEAIEAEYFYLYEFKFNNGEVLKDAKVEYITFGTPQYDNEGIISNAVIYFHGSSGSCYSARRISEDMGSGEIFDTDKFFFISVSALGCPGSASPSTTGLMNRFPEYDVGDMVNFQKQFIEEKFGITHVKGLIGNSILGMHLSGFS